MNEWLLNGTPNSFWISGFFFPQGFLTGCLQTHARQYRIAIDELAFSFAVLAEEEPEEIEELPEDGVYVHGLYMDGARYNRDDQVIDDQNPVSALAPLLTAALGRTLLPHAPYLVQACQKLPAQHRRVHVPRLQDRQARWSALHYGPVNQLHRLRGCSLHG